MRSGTHDRAAGEQDGSVRNFATRHKMYYHAYAPHCRTAVGVTGSRPHFFEDVLPLESAMSSDTVTNSYPWDLSSGRMTFMAL